MFSLHFNRKKKLLLRWNEDEWENFSTVCKRKCTPNLHEVHSFLLLYESRPSTVINHRRRWTSDRPILCKIIIMRGREAASKNKTINLLTTAVVYSAVPNSGYIADILWRISWLSDENGYRKSFSIELNATSVKGKWWWLFVVVASNKGYCKTQINK